MRYKQYTAISVLTLIALLGGILFTNTSSSQAASPLKRVIVTFDAVNTKAEEALENKGGHILKNLPLVNGFVVLVPERTIPALASIKGVRTVEKDAKVFTLKPPNGCDPWPECKNGGDDEEPPPPPPPQTLEWGVDKIDAELAWATSKGTGVKVAVIDTGIDKDHEDLVTNIKGGVNFVAPQKGAPWNRVADPDKWDDDNGHGTHVAGIIAAIDNEIGVIGVAPEAHLYGVKVLDSEGSGYVSDVIEGINWATNNNMQVINLSLGSASDVQALHDAVDAAYNAGLIVVAAAGNSGDGDSSTNEVIYPAKYSSVIAVGATASDDSTPYWSAEGEQVELAAPGVSIYSTWKDGLFETKNGTSMASPHVAGTVALMLANAINPAQIRTMLQNTADDLGSVGHDNFYGYGLIDAEESVTGTQTN